MDEVEQLEAHALKITALSNHVPMKKYDTLFSDIKISENELKIPNHAKMVYAQSLLTSKEYESKESAAFLPLSSLEKQISIKMTSSIHQSEINQNFLQKMQYLISLITMLFFLFSFLSMSHCSLSPLRIYANKMKGFTTEDLEFFRLKPKGSFETYSLANEINHILEILSNALEESQDKSTYLSVVSHEIRTSMNTIVGISEIMNREEDTKKIKEDAIDIQNASRYLLSVINDILDITKLDSGNTSIVSRTFQTRELFSELSDLFLTPSTKKSLQYNVNIDEAFPSILLGDDIRIRQICMNLISNAIKYTSQGSVTINASCKFLSNEKTLFVFSVADTGIGIKDTDFQKLFQPFSRLPYATNMQTEGTGLGLAISKRYADLMNGKIEFESEIGKGSIFTFSVPLTVIDSTPIFPLLKDHGYQEHKITFLAPDANILVVDDHMTNLKVAYGLLETYQILADTASSGLDAILMCEANSYDLIFMDIMMPEMDGIETSQRILSNKPQSKIIALTADIVAGAFDHFSEAGMIALLKKPIESAELEKLLVSYLPSEKIIFYESLQSASENSQPEGTSIHIPGIDSILGMKYCSNKPDSYHNLLETFYQASLPLISDLKVQAEKYNYEAVTISVHGLKSASLSIGAKIFSKHAALIEKILKSGHIADGMMHIDSLLDEYEHLIKNIDFYLHTEHPAVSTENIEKEELIQLLNNLRESITQYDFSVSYQILSQITSFQYEEDPSLLNEFRDLYRLLKYCEYTKAEQLCHKIHMMLTNS